MQRFKLTLLLFTALVVSGCAATHADLERRYGRQVNATEQPPVVVIPGFMGSRLIDESGVEAWPAVSERDQRENFRIVRLRVDETTLEPEPSALVADGIADRAAGIALDSRLLGVLERVGGYTLTRPGSPAGLNRKRLYVFDYDWRQDNVKSVRELKAFLDGIRRDHGDPSLKVDVVAHGMGGLIVRYFSRYGTVDVLDGNEFPLNYRGADYFRRVVLMGVPGLGTAAATYALYDGLPPGRGVPPEAIATMPSIYQVLPHPITTWALNAKGEPLDIDVFDTRVWRELQWSIFDPAVRARVKRYFGKQDGAGYLNVMEAYFEKHIERGRRFVWSLTVPADELPLDYVVLSADCDLTPARLLIESTEKGPRAAAVPRQVRRPDRNLDYERLMLEPGDGTVTKGSVLARQVSDPTVMRHEYSWFPLDYALFICERHDLLTANTDFQNNLLNILLSADPE